MAVSLTNHLRFAELGLSALETISTLLTRSGVISGEGGAVIALVGRIADTILAGIHNGDKPEDIERRLGQLATELTANDAVVDSVDSKFPT